MKWKFIPTEFDGYLKFGLLSEEIQNAVKN